MTPEELTNRVKAVEKALAAKNWRIDRIDAEDHGFKVDIQLRRMGETRKHLLALSAAECCAPDLAKIILQRLTSAG